MFFMHFFHLRKQGHNNPRVKIAHFGIRYQIVKISVLQQIKLFLKG